MNNKTIGFILVAVAIVLGILAISNASIWNPDRGFIYNVQRADTFQTGFEAYTYSCDPNSISSSVRANCSSLGIGTGRRATYLMKLSNALVVATILGLAGIGMMTIKRREE